MASIAAEVGEPRLRWITTICQAFEATMRAELAEAERLSTVVLELGTEIGEPDAFTLYAGQLFANRSFAGRYDELLPLTQEMVSTSPEMRAVPPRVRGHLRGRRT